MSDEGGVQPCGLGARDTLRLEMKYPLYGHDIDTQTTPLEAGLRFAVKFKKGDFVGREALVRQKEAGLSRRWVGFVMKSRGVPREGYGIFLGRQQVGQVTSGTHSPLLKQGIGCAYVESDVAGLGQILELDIRGRRAIPSRWCRPPFTGRRICSRASGQPLEDSA